MNRPRNPLVIAHRGASGTLPENTLPAYELAVSQGADMIEIDLHRTRDGETVVTHDEDLARLGGRGEVA
ncbi:MAG: glycerophosphodiester phosphodiesterase, partial [Deltaproteobacteria bacterium]|nr:glycerophosphodiester phosphodiesterase [Deltaproteobacteria bacterium]